MEENTSMTRHDTWNRSYEAAMMDYYTAGNGLFPVKQADKDYITMRYVELITEAAKGITDDIRQDMQSLEQLADLCSCTDISDKLHQLLTDRTGDSRHV